jgi:hypothetical protein
MEASDEPEIQQTHAYFTLDRFHLAQTTRNPGGQVILLLAQAELGYYILIAFGIVGFQIVQQTTPLADQHEKAAARAVVFQVRFEVFRQLTNALA